MEPFVQALRPEQAERPREAMTVPDRQRLAVAAVPPDVWCRREPAAA